MDVWKDITSFQAIGRSINSTVINKSDIYDFLQFCTELVYCDNVYVSLHGPAYMAEKTKQIRNTLIKFGIEEDFVELYEFNNLETIKNTLSDIGMDMHFHIENIKIDKNRFSDTHEAQFPESYKNKLKPTTDILKKVLLKNRNPDRFKDEIEESLKDDKYNVALYTLLKDDFLIEELRKSMKNQFWNNQQLLGLVASTRVSINQTISKKNNLIYAPSFLRSQKNREFTMKTANDKILTQYLKKYEKELFDSSNSFLSTDIRIPSAIKVFLLEGSDSPLKVLNKAINARRELAWLRNKILGDLNSIFYSNENDSRIKTLQNELQSCKDDILISLGSKKIHKSIINHISIDTNLCPSLGLGAVEDIYKMLRFYKNRKDYILITHILNCASKKDKDYLEARIHELYLKNREI